jgi:hypothetical protein
MKPVSQLMAEIKDAGLIYDPVITSMIIGYEVGHFQRNIFYAQMIDESKDSELQLRDGWLANAKIEFSDCVTQCRVLCEVMGWNWQSIVETGEAKLQERIDTYKARGVRPNTTLMNKFRQTMGGFSLSRPAIRPRSGD